MITENIGTTELDIYQAIAGKTAEMLEASHAKDLELLEKLSNEREQLMRRLEATAISTLTPEARQHKAGIITEILAIEQTLQSTVMAWRRHISGLLRINRVQRTLTDAYTQTTTPPR